MTKTAYREYVVPETPAFHISGQRRDRRKAIGALNQKNNTISITGRLKETFKDLKTDLTREETLGYTEASECWYDCAKAETYLELPLEQIAERVIQIIEGVPFLPLDKKIIVGVSRDAAGPFGVSMAFSLTGMMWVVDKCTPSTRPEKGMLIIPN